MKQWNNEAIEQSILKTLAYADIFGWPVMENEILLKMQNAKIKNALKKLIENKIIGYSQNYYFLYGKDKLVERRLQREKWAREKLVIAKKAAATR